MTDLELLQYVVGRMQRNSTQGNTKQMQMILNALLELHREQKEQDRRITALEAERMPG